MELTFAKRLKRMDSGLTMDLVGNTNPGFPPKGFLIIDQYLWKVDVDIDQEELRFLSKEGNESKAFRKGYRTAFTYLGDTLGVINVSIE